MQHDILQVMLVKIGIRYMKQDKWAEMGKLNYEVTNKYFIIAKSY